MRRRRDDAMLSGFARSLLHIVIAFGLAVGGLYLAFWAFEADQPVMGWIGLAAACSGFLWLLIMQLFYGGGGGDGEGFGLLTFILLGGLIAGGGALAFLGLGLIWLGVLAVGAAIIWTVFTWGADLFG